jgi:hypothetical protein
MSTDYTSAEAIQGLLNENKEAFIDGLATALAEMGFWFITTEMVATKEVVQGLPPSGYHEHTPGQDIVTEEMREGYTAPFTRYTLAYGVALDSIARATIKPQIMVDFLNNLGIASGNGVVQTCYDDQFNNGWGTNWSDGVPWFSNSHPSNVGLQDNLLASTLDHAAMQAAEIMLLDQVGPDGQKMGFRPARLVVPTALKNVASAVLSPGVLVPSAGSTSFATPNPTEGIAQRIVAPSLTSTTRSILMAEQARPRCIFVETSSPVVKEQPGTKSDIKILDQITILVGRPTWRGSIGIGA